MRQIHFQPEDKPELMQFINEMELESEVNTPEMTRVLSETYESGFPQPTWLLEQRS